MDNLLYNACSIGDIESALLEIQNNNYHNWNRGLANACYGGHKELALLMIEKGANDWNWVLANACLRGHKELALLMIKKGANAWNWGLTLACYGGHKALALLMIEKGADKWNWGLANACFGGHKELALLMIEKGADINQCSIQLGEEDIERLVKIGITQFRNKYYKLKIWIRI